MRIHGFYGIHYGVCIKSSARADLGVICGHICTQSIKTASRAWNCDQHHHHYSPCVAVPVSSLIQLLLRPRERERNNNKHRQRGISWRFVLGFLISSSVRFYQVKSLRQYTEYSQTERNGQCLTCAMLFVSIRHKTVLTVQCFLSATVQCCTSIIQFCFTFSVLLVFLIHM